MYIYIGQLTFSEGEGLVVVDLIVQLQSEKEREIVVAIDERRRFENRLGPEGVVSGIILDNRRSDLAVGKVAGQRDA